MKDPRLTREQIRQGFTLLNTLEQRQAVTDGQGMVSGAIQRFDVELGQVVQLGDGSITSSRGLGRKAFPENRVIPIIRTTAENFTSNI